MRMEGAVGFFDISGFTKLGSDLRNVESKSQETAIIRESETQSGLETYLGPTDGSNALVRVSLTCRTRSNVLDRSLENETEMTAGAFSLLNEKHLSLSLSLSPPRLEERERESMRDCESDRRCASRRAVDGRASGRSATRAH